MNKKLLYVAIHARDIKQAQEETAKVINEGGADGVFLVNNGGRVTPGILLYITEMVKTKFPDHFIGANLLGLGTVQALVSVFMQGNKFDGLWVDDGGIREVDGSVYIDDEVEDPLVNCKVKYFGSIAMKYQPPVQNLSKVAMAAAKHFDVVVTSGERTGSPPTIGKINVIRTAIGPEPLLAVASGIDIGNVDKFLPSVDIFIVGASLWEDPEDEFVYHPVKVKKLKERISSYEK